MSMWILWVLVGTVCIGQSLSLAPDHPPLFTISSCRLPTLSKAQRSNILKQRELNIMSTRHKDDLGACAPDEGVCILSKLASIPSLKVQNNPKPYTINGLQL